MRFKFFFIFFSLIFGILTLSLKKKIQKNKNSQDIRSIFMKRKLCLRKPKKFGEECDTNEQKEKFIFRDKLIFVIIIALRVFVF